MATVLYPSPIFGPIKSRRLGISLGINLLPPDGKVCTFDCIYCECGYNRQHRPTQPMPTRGEVREALEKRLQEMSVKGPRPDVLTFAGNGEPTAHPEFAAIIDDTLALRDRYFPEAKVSVLSNSTRVEDKDVREALMKVDNPIMKLDTVDAGYIHRLDRPTGHYDVERIIGSLREMAGKPVIQTMFLKGFAEDGTDMDNTGEEYVKPWIDAVKSIAPREVMIYTIDRETPARHLRKATPEELDHIVSLLQMEGIRASASY